MIFKQKNQSPRASRGFTLIELLVVIAIIGILASVTLVAMVTYRERAQQARVEQEVAGFQKAAAIFYADNNAYPNPLDTANGGTNYDDACLTGPNGVPQKCCISEGGCFYDSTPLVPITGGPFASAPRAPRWLTYLGERAEAYLGGLLPGPLTEAPSSATTGYKGVFYDCTDATCSDAHVYFTLPQTRTECSRGVSHGGGLEGVCAQNITGRNEDGDGSVGDVEDCGNGLDDDNDGDIDCYDTECVVACTVPEDCTTAGDEDDDGDADCADSDCVGESDPSGSFTCEQPESSCNDSYDNDGDSCTDDSGNDSNCGGGEDDGTGQCDDGLDNDCDDLIDCEDTDDCSGATGCIGDYCGDETCSEGEVCEEDCAAETHCDDEDDNDEDESTDCDDTDCADDSACVTLAEDCDAAGDEDDNGYADCADSACTGWASGYSWSSEKSYTYQYCSAGSKLNGGQSNNVAFCTDGEDNNNNGCEDGADYSCGGTENSTGDSACDDETDNDCDGNVNCDDTDCQYSGSACDSGNCPCGDETFSCDCGDGTMSCGCGDDSNSCPCY